MSTRSSTSSSPNQEPAPQFPQFPRLPEEIRRLVWHFSLAKFNPSSAGVSHFYPAGGASPIPVRWPPWSSTCREAREETRRGLIILTNLTDEEDELVPVDLPAREFDPDLDLLVVPLNFPGIFSQVAKLEYISQLRRLALSDNTLIVERHGFKELVPRLKSLVELMVLFQDEIPREDVNIPKSFSWELVDPWDALTRILGPCNLAQEYLGDGECDVIPSRLKVNERPHGVVKRSVEGLYPGEGPFVDPWAPDYEWSTDEDGRDDEDEGSGGDES